MKRDLTDLNREQSDKFFDYFRAKLRAQDRFLSEPTGSGRFIDDKYEVDLTSDLTLDDGTKTEIIWTLLFDRNSKIISISVEAEQNKNELAAVNFIADTLQKALSEKREIFFVRSYFGIISDSNLVGEYWLSGIRFAPLFPEDNSKLTDSERILVFDQNIEAIDETHAKELAKRQSTIYSAYMSLILDCGLYKPTNEYRYLFPTQPIEKRTPKREKTGFVDYDRPISMPEKNQLCKCEKFSGSVYDSIKFLGRDLKCPIETRKILKGIQQLDSNKKEAIDKCALLYQLALTLGRDHPTVKIAYEYASIDAITKRLGKEEYTGFSDFVKKNLDSIENQKIQSLLNYIHEKVRSAHWHSGEFTLGELDHRSDFLTNPELHIRSDNTRQAHNIMRTAIFNWILSEIP